MWESKKSQSGMWFSDFWVILGHFHLGTIGLSRILNPSKSGIPRKLHIKIVAWPSHTFGHDWGQNASNRIQGRSKFDLELWSQDENFLKNPKIMCHFAKTELTHPNAWKKKIVVQWVVCDGKQAAYQKMNNWNMQKPPAPTTILAAKSHRHPDNGCECICVCVWCER